MRSNLSLRKRSANWLNQVELAIAFVIGKEPNYPISGGSLLMSSSYAQEFFSEYERVAIKHMNSSLVLRMSMSDRIPRIKMLCTTDDLGLLKKKLKTFEPPSCGLTLLECVDRALELMIHNDEYLPQFQREAMPSILRVLVKLSNDKIASEDAKTFLEKFIKCDVREVLKQFEELNKHLTAVANQSGRPLDRRQFKAYHAALQTICGGGAEADQNGAADEKSNQGSSRSKERSMIELEIEAARNLDTTFKIKADDAYSYFAKLYKETGRFHPFCQALTQIDRERTDVFLVDGIWRISGGYAYGGQHLHKMLEQSFQNPNLMMRLSNVWKRNGVPPSLPTWRSYKLVRPSWNWLLNLDKNDDQGLKARESWFNEALECLTTSIFNTLHNIFINSSEIPQGADYRACLSKELSAAHDYYLASRLLSQDLLYGDEFERIDQCPEHLKRTIENFINRLYAGSRKNLLSKFAGIIEARKAQYADKSVPLSRLCGDLEAAALGRVKRFWCDEIQRNFELQLPPPNLFRISALNELENHQDQVLLDYDLLPFRHAYKTWRSDTKAQAENLRRMSALAQSKPQPSSKDRPKPMDGSQNRPLTPKGGLQFGRREELYKTMPKAKQEDPTFGFSTMSRPAPREQLYSSSTLPRSAPKDQLHRSGTLPRSAPREQLYSSGTLPRSAPREQLYSSGTLPRAAPKEQIYGLSSMPRAAQQESIYGFSPMPRAAQQEQIYGSSMRSRAAPKDQLYSSSILPRSAPSDQLYSSSTLPRSAPSDQLYSSSTLPRRAPQAQFYSSLRLPGSTPQDQVYSSTRLPRSRPQIQSLSSRTIGKPAPRDQLYTQKPVLDEELSYFEEPVDRYYSLPGPMPAQSAEFDWYNNRVAGQNQGAPFAHTGSFGPIATFSDELD